MDDFHNSASITLSEYSTGQVEPPDQPESEWEGTTELMAKGMTEEMVENWDHSFSLLPAVNFRLGEAWCTRKDIW